MDNENCKNEILLKTNALIRSNVSVSAIEYKLFNEILLKAQIQKGNNGQVMAKLTLKEIQSFIKKDVCSTPKNILKMLEKFVSIPIRFEIDNKYIITSLINVVEVDKDTMEFMCYLDQRMYQVLMNYKSLGFSPIDLKLIKKKVNGYYTQRFYELFRSWSNVRSEVTFDVDYLKKWLELDNQKSYKLYSNFKNKVILAAIKEINEKLNMKVSFKENKSSRKITSITFKISDSEPRQYLSNDKHSLKDKSKYKANKKDKINVKGFNNFDEREYTKEEWENIENKLLGWGN